MNEIKTKDEDENRYRNDKICHHYVVGVSIGTMSQPTAIAVVEQETRARGDWSPENTGLSLRHLERVPLDMRYPEMVDHIDGLVARLAEEDSSSDDPDLLLDVTGTGRSVGNLIEASGLKPIRITITAGSGENEVKYNDWQLSKAELVGTLQVTLQTDRLKMAAELDLVSTLVSELQTFKIRTTVINGNDPESWREGQFDDLVFAVGMAVWRAGKQTPYPKDWRMERKRYAARNRGPLNWMSA